MRYVSTIYDKICVRFVSESHIKLELGIKPAGVFLQEVIFFACEVVDDMHCAFDVVVSECKLGVYVVFGYVHFRC